MDTEIFTPSAGSCLFYHYVVSHTPGHMWDDFLINFSFPLLSGFRKFNRSMGEFLRDMWNHAQSEIIKENIIGDDMNAFPELWAQSEPTVGTPPN